MKMIWTATEKYDNKLAVTERNMERNVLNLKRIDKIPNTEMRKKTKFEDARGYISLQDKEMEMGCLRCDIMGST